MDAEKEITALAEAVGVLEPDHYDGAEEWGAGLLMAMVAFGLSVVAMGEWLW